MASTQPKMKSAFIRTFFQYLVLITIFATYLASAKILGLEVINFLLSPFFPGSYAGSFILKYLSLGPLGLVVLVFLFLNYFRVYVLAVALGVLVGKLFTNTNVVKALTGLGVGITAIYIEYITVDADVIDNSSRFTANDLLSSLLVVVVSLFIFYNLKKHY